jgi:hypothetical protein
MVGDYSKLNLILECPLTLEGYSIKEYFCTRIGGEFVFLGIMGFAIDIA